MSFISTLWEWLSKDRIRDWAFHWSFRLSIWGKSSLDLFYCVYKHIKNLRKVSRRENIHLPRVCDDMNHCPPDLLVPAPRGVVLVDHLGFRLSVPFQFSVLNFYFSPSGLKIRLTSKYFSWKDIVLLLITLCWVFERDPILDCAVTKLGEGALPTTILFIGTEINFRPLFSYLILLKLLQIQLHVPS